MKLSARAGLGEKGKPIGHGHHPLARWIIGVLAAALFPSMSAHGIPQWWYEKGVITGHPKDENNKAVANVGQLKNFALKAKEHMDAYIGSTPTDSPANDALNNLIGGWDVYSDPEGYKNLGVVNLAQVKYVADMLYDRLDEVRYGGFADGWRPWNTANPPPVAENLAVARLDQVLNIFDFDLSTLDFDTNENGDQNSGNGVPDYLDDGDGDGVSLAMERIQQTRDDSADSDGDGIDDAADAAPADDPNDPPVSWARRPVPEYWAVYITTINSTPGDNVGAPVAINDKGEVIFNGEIPQTHPPKIWSQRTGSALLQTLPIPADASGYEYNNYPIVTDINDAYVVGKVDYTGSNGDGNAAVKWTIDSLGAGAPIHPAGTVSSRLLQLSQNGTGVIEWQTESSIEARVWNLAQGQDDASFGGASNPEEAIIGDNGDRAWLAGSQIQFLMAGETSEETVTTATTNSNIEAITRMNGRAAVLVDGELWLRKDGSAGTAGLWMNMSPQFVHEDFIDANENGQLITPDELWQNGSSYDFADLIANDAEFEGSHFSAIALNKRGVVVGLAGSKAYLLLPMAFWAEQKISGDPAVQDLTAVRGDGRDGGGVKQGADKNVPVVLEYGKETAELQLLIATGAELPDDRIDDFTWRITGQAGVTLVDDLGTTLQGDFEATGEDFLKGKFGQSDTVPFIPRINVQGPYQIELLYQGSVDTRVVETIGIDILSVPDPLSPVVAGSHGVDVYLPAIAGNGGRSGGWFVLRADELSQALNDRRSLRLAVNGLSNAPPLNSTSVAATVDAANGITQLDSDAMKTEVQAGPTGYTIRYLLPNQTIPFRTVKVERVGNKLTFTDDSLPGRQFSTRVIYGGVDHSLWGNGTGAHRWFVKRSGGSSGPLDAEELRARRVIATEVDEGSSLLTKMKVEHRVSHLSQLVYKTVSHHLEIQEKHDTKWLTVETVNDPDGVDLHTFFEYIDNGDRPYDDDFAAINRLRKITAPGNFVANFAYFPGSPWVHQIKTPFKNAAADRTLAVSVNDLVETRTETVGAGAQEVSKSIVTRAMGTTSLVVHGNSSSTLSGQVSFGSDGRPTAIEHLDGTLSTISYPEPDTKTTVTRSGVTTAFEVTALGYASSTSVVENGVTLSEAAATAVSPDPVGRPTHFTHVGGWESEVAYDWLGVCSVRDRDGTESFIVRDDLGRVVSAEIYFGAGAGNPASFIRRSMAYDGLTLTSSLEGENEGSDQSMTKTGSISFDVSGLAANIEEVSATNPANPASIYDTIVTGALVAGARGPEGQPIDLGTDSALIGRYAPGPDGDRAYEEHYFSDGRLREITGTGADGSDGQTLANFSYGAHSEGESVTITPPPPEGPTTIKWDYLGRIIESSRGLATTTYQYYDSASAVGERGKLQSVTDPDGVVLTLDYDAKGMLTSRSILGRTVELRRTVADTGANPGKIVYTLANTPQGGGALQDVLEEVIDPDGLTRTVRDKLTGTTSITTLSAPAQGQWTATTRGHDNSWSRFTFENSQLSRLDLYDDDPEDGGSSIYHETVSQDALRRLKAIATSGGVSVSAVRNLAGFPVSESYTVDGGDPEQTGLTWYPGGLLSGLAHPDGSQTTTQKNRAGLLTLLAAPGAETVSFNYLIDGRLDSYAKGGVTTKFNYQAGTGYLQSKVFNDGDSPTHTSSYTYSDAGLLKTHQESSSAGGGTSTTTTITYAPNDILEDTLAFSGSNQDLAPRDITSRDSAGRVTALSDDVGTYGISYYGDDKLESIYFVGNSKAGDLKRHVLYDYDAFGRLECVKIREDDGGVPGALEYDTYLRYDAEGRLCQIQGDDQPGGIRYYTYGFGSPDRVNVPDLLQGGHPIPSNPSSDPKFTTNFDYEGLNAFLTDVKNMNHTLAEESRYQYLRDKLGRREWRKVSGSQFGSSTEGRRHVHKYVYDAKGRLDEQEAYTGTVIPDIPANHVVTEDWDYVYTDGGSFSYKAVPAGGGGATYFSNNLDQYTEFGSQFDLTWNNGNLATADDSSGTANDRDVTWDDRNRLAQIDVGGGAGNGGLTVTFAYDFMGRRVAKTVTGTQNSTEYFLYDGWNVIAIYNGSGALQETFVWGRDLSGSTQGAGGVGGLLSSYDHNANARYYYTHDGNGNVSEVLDDNGTVVAHYEYDPFGGLIYSSGTYENASRFRFSTKYFDKETGYYYFGFRYYDPDHGMWLSRDPLGEAGGFNVYAFVQNDPINRVDPLGLDDLVTAVWNQDKEAWDIIFSDTPNPWLLAANPLALAIDAATSAAHLRIGTMIMEGEWAGFVDVGGGKVTTVELIKKEAESWFTAWKAFVKTDARPRSRRIWGDTLRSSLVVHGDQLSAALNFANDPNDPSGSELMAPADFTDLIANADHMEDHVKELLLFYATGPIPITKFASSRTAQHLAALDSIVVPKAPRTGAGLIDDSANFAQKTFGETFSETGKFANQTIDDIAGALRRGDLTPADVPIEFFTRNSGQMLISNTRSAQALTRAGIPRELWHGIDVAGDYAGLRRLAGQLRRNQSIGRNGTPTVRPSGGGN